LKEIRQFRKPIDHDEIEEHAKKYEELMLVEKNRQRLLRLEEHQN
jgi:hypothetical protein